MSGQCCSTKLHPYCTAVFFKLKHPVPKGKESHKTQGAQKPRRLKSPLPMVQLWAIVPGELLQWSYKLVGKCGMQHPGAHAVGSGDAPDFPGVESYHVAPAFPINSLVHGPFSTVHLYCNWDERKFALISPASHTIINPLPLSWCQFVLNVLTHLAKKNYYHISDIARQLDNLETPAARPGRGRLRGNSLTWVVLSHGKRLDSRVV